MIWVVSLLTLTIWELTAVAMNLPGGPLSHFAWWLYGERWSMRWWLAAGFFNGLFFWTAWHFMFHWPALRELGLCIGILMALGAVGWCFGIGR